MLILENALSKAGAQIIVNIIAMLYTTLAKIYSLLTMMIENTAFEYDSIRNLSSNVYILAGVFMLFRVTISAINYLIDPDKVNDKNAGAGKIITRIIIVFALIMTLDNVIFPLLKGIQETVIDPEDGLIYKVFPLANTNIRESNIEYFESKISNNIITVNLMPTVFASTTITCYYYTMYDSSTIVSVNNGSNYSTNVKLGGFYALQYQYTSSDNCPSDSYHIGGAFNTDEACVKFISDSYTSQKTTYTTSVNGQEDLKYLEEIKIKGGVSWDVLIHNGCSARMGFANQSIFSSELDLTTLKIGKSGAFYGGAKSFSELYEKYLKQYEKQVNKNGADNVDLPDSFSDEQRKGVIEDSNINFNATADGLAFSRMVAKVFQYCANKENCDEIQNNMFESSPANKKFSEAVKDGKLGVDLLGSLIVAIGLIIYILLLCVDVIVRNLKLLVLEVLAPIPVISYVNPNDKVFNNWLKAYFATYLDLFFKLIAISLAINFISPIFIDKIVISNSSFALIIYIFAVFTFAKTLPNFISKIFGLDGAAGTFKDTFGMMKAAVGMGAGATLAAGAGLASAGLGIASAKGAGNKIGAALQGLGTGLGGVFKGASAGASGKIGAGASATWKKNSQRNAAYANGATFGSLLGASTAGLVGLNYAQRKDKEIAALEADSNNRKAFTDTKGNLEALADSNKAVAAAKNRAISTGNLADQQRYEQLRDATIKYNLGDNTAFNGMALTSSESSELSSTSKQASFMAIKSEADSIASTLGIAYGDDYDSYGKAVGAQKGKIQENTSKANVIKSDPKYKSSAEANKAKSGGSGK